MKYVKYILGLLLFFLCFNVQASSKNRVNLYLFYSDTCPHCKSEMKLLDSLEKEYDNLYVYKYEVTNNGDLLNQVASLYNISIKTTPLTIIGDVYYFGYSKNATKRQLVNVIEYYSKNGYQDKIGELLGYDLPTYEIVDSKEDIDEYLDSKNNKYVDIPFWGSVNMKKVALPLVTIVLGLLDGFNPCSMWVLLFLISMLMGMKNKKRLFILGISFLVTSALIYFLFMVAWLNVTNLLSSTSILKLVVGIIALVGGLINLRGYFKTRKDNGCSVVDEHKRNIIFNKIKKFTHEKSFWLALLGIVTLAVSVNIIELACSAGLPVMFIEILNINDLSLLEYYIYILLYVLVFMLDDIIVFVVAVITMELTGFSTKYGKLSKLIGGILMLLIGLLMVIKPEWLMFNFG